MSRFLPFPLFCFFATVMAAQNEAPVVSNLAASADWMNKTLTLTYDVADAENDPLEISVGISGDGGETYSLTSLLPQPSGDAGFPVSPGTGRTVTLDISALTAIQSVFTVRLVADDKKDFDFQQLVDEVDSTRLRADLEFVEGIRHRMTGLTHLNEMRDSLRNHFSGLGLPLNEHTFLYSGATGRNIIGSSPGTSSAEKVVIVDAHYDTMKIAPGADDNGSGTVGVMEIARLLSRYPAKKTLRFIGFDMEEDGLRGSIAYLTNGLLAGEQVEGVFNFEMIGYYSEQPNSQEIPPGFNILFPDATTQIAANQNRGDFITNVANTGSSPLGLLFNSSAQQYVPNLKVVPLVVPGNGTIAPDLLRSDHAPFWLANMPALMLTDGADFRNNCYHTAQDTLDGKLNFTFMSNVVKATLAAAAQLADIQHGGWATATFENTVGTFETPACRFGIRYNDRFPDRITLFADRCLLQEVSVGISDGKGVLVCEKAVRLNETEHDYSISVPILPPGMYFATIHWPGGVFTEKFVVSR